MPGRKPVVSVIKQPVVNDKTQAKCKISAVGRLAAGIKTVSGNKERCYAPLN
jgi:hypothetical protein